MPDVLTLWGLGGAMYLLISRSSPPSPRAMARRRPGWIARCRARGGIRHRHDRAGVGYTSATRSVHLTARELAGHGLAVGGPGSGKTTFLQLLVEASIKAARMPCVIVDPKGSPALVLAGEPMNLARLRRLLDRGELLRTLEPHRDLDTRIVEWIGHLEQQHGGIEDSGARGLDRTLGTLLDGVALLGSLHSCPEALRHIAYRDLPAAASEVQP